MDASTTWHNLHRVDESVAGAALLSGYTRSARGFFVTLDFRADKCGELFATFAARLLALADEQLATLLDPGGQHTL